jgi:endonuclease YncB( thermonuclease family)
MTARTPALKVRISSADYAERQPYPRAQRPAQVPDYRISEGVVTCKPKDRDRYGRVVAVCRAYCRPSAATASSTSLRRTSPGGASRHVERPIPAALGVKSRGPRAD